MSDQHKTGWKFHGARAMATALIAGACIPALAQEPPKPAADKVRLVIMRLQEMNGAQAPADILEIRGGRPEYIGRLYQGEQLILEFPPEGGRQFMTMGGGVGGSDFLFVEPLTPGKTYYVMLRYHWGTGGSIPVPVRPNSPLPPGDPAVTAAIAKYKVVVPTQANRDAFARERADVQVRREYNRVTRMYATSRPQSQKDDHTLRPQDDYQPVK